MPDILGRGHGFLAIGVGLLAWTVALTAYSYVQWRNDPDRAMKPRRLLTEVHLG